METRLAGAFVFLVIATFSLVFILSRIGYIDNAPIKSSTSAPRSQTLPFESFFVERITAKRLRDPHFAPELQRFLDIIIAQYTTWHQEQRRLCEVDSTHFRRVRLLVFRYNRHVGLGDRIQAILYTYLVAVASKRLFFIDWKQPVPLTNVLHSPPEYNFTFDDSLFLASTEEEEIISGPAKFSNFDVFLTPKRVLIETAANAFAFKKFFSLYDRYPELELSRKIHDANLKGFRPERDEVAPFILQALFRSSASLRTSLEKLVPFGGKRYVSLHARLGYGVGEKEGRFDLKRKGLTLRSASKCIGVLAATLAHKHGHERVFVATDTERARKWLQAGVHDVLPHADVAQSSINATHLQALQRRERYPEASERERKFEEVFLDVGLLAMAESMVFFRSGFAEVALWLGVMTDAVKVDIRDCAPIVRGSRNASQLLQQRRPNAFKELLRDYLQLAAQRHVHVEQA